MQALTDMLMQLFYNYGFKAVAGLYYLLPQAAGNTDFGKLSPTFFNELLAEVMKAAQDNATALLQDGFHLLNLLLLIMLVWKCLQLALKQASIGELIGEIFHLVWMWGMAAWFLHSEADYKMLTTAINKGFDYIGYKLLTGQAPAANDASYMINMLTKGEGVILGAINDIWEHMRQLFFSSNAPAILEVLDGILNVFTIIILLLAAMYYFIVFVSSQVLIYISLSLGPIFIPWLVTPVTQHYFMGWLRFTIIAGMYKVMGMLVATFGGELLSWLDKRIKGAINNADMQTNSVMRTNSAVSDLTQGIPCPGDMSYMCDSNATANVDTGQVQGDLFLSVVKNDLAYIVVAVLLAWMMQQVPGWANSIISGSIRMRTTPLDEFNKLKKQAGKALKMATRALALATGAGAVATVGEMAAGGWKSAMKSYAGKGAQALGRRASYADQMLGYAAINAADKVMDRFSDWRQRAGQQGGGEGRGPGTPADGAGGPPPGGPGSDPQGGAGSGGASLNTGEYLSQGMGGGGNAARNAETPSATEAGGTTQNIGTYLSQGMGGGQSSAQGAASRSGSGNVVRAAPGVAQQTSIAQSLQQAFGGSSPVPAAAAGAEPPIANRIAQGLGQRTPASASAPAAQAAASATTGAAATAAEGTPQASAPPPPPETEYRGGKPFQTNNMHQGETDGGFQTFTVDGAKHRLGPQLRMNYWPDGTARSASIAGWEDNFEAGKLRLHPQDRAKLENTNFVSNAAEYEQQALKRGYDPETGKPIDHPVTSLNHPDNGPGRAGNVGLRQFDNVREGPDHPKYGQTWITREGPLSFQRTWDGKAVSYWLSAHPEISGKDVKNALKNPKEYGVRMLKMDRDKAHSLLEAERRYKAPPLSALPPRPPWALKKLPPAAASQSFRHMMSPYGRGQARKDATGQRPATPNRAKPVSPPPNARMKYKKAGRDAWERKAKKTHRKLAAAERKT